MLNDDFKEFAALLHSNRVDYLIVGGYALAAYGHPRYTGDLDFWVGTDAANAARVLNALREFGFGALGGIRIWPIWTRSKAGCRIHPVNNRKAA